MMKDQHKTISLADQIFEQLEHDILVGEYSRGELLTENRLSELFGVSRTPIREVLRRLEQEHIVSISPKGAMVLGILPEDIDDIYEIRLRLEGLAVRWAAERMSAEDLAQLKEALDLQEFYTSRSDAISIRDMDSRFHDTIYEHCGSIPLADTLAPLHRRVMKYRRVSVSNHSRAVDSLAEHKAIYEAIAAKDGDLAEKLIIEHIKNARQNIKTRSMPGRSPAAEQGKED